MNTLKIIFITVVLLLVYVFSDNIHGYYRFNKYCEAESGFKIYKNLESNHGWLVSGRSEAKEVSYFNGVKFARYKDIKTGEYFDVKYINGSPDNDKSFEITPSNFHDSVKYKWVNFSKKINNEVRLGANGHEVFDDLGIKMIGFYNFTYEKFNRDYMPLDMNPIVRCPEARETQRASFDSLVDDVNSAFIN